MSTSSSVFAKYSFYGKDIAEANKIATQVASGQTLGFLPKEIDAYKDYLASVVEVQPLPSNRWSALIAFPAKLFETDIAGLLTVLFGKISFMPGIRLDEVYADEMYLSKLKGPRIGLKGIRALVGVSEKRPLLMGILKPGIGPTDDELVKNFAQLTEAGVHLVKDDEVRVDSTDDQALRRLEKILKSSSKKSLYVQALNGPAFELKARALKLQSAGAQGFLVCPFTYGLSVAQSLCADAEIKVPVFMHPAFTGVMQSPDCGVAPAAALGTLMRWLGADGVLYPSPYGSIALSLKDSTAIHQELTKNMGPLKVSASIPSAGILPEFVEAISKDFGTEVVVNAGTGMAKSGASVADGAKAFLNQIEKHFLDKK